MKKTKLLSLIFILSFLGLSTLILLNAKATTIKTTVQASPLDNVAQPAFPLANVTVDQVDQNVQILQAGSVAINDTIQLSANQTTTLAEYPLGFPYGYKYHLAYVYAFNTSNPTQAFNVSLDTGLGNYVGYYGVTVIFPQSGVQLFVGEKFRFTVGFVFSDLVISSTYTSLSETVPPKNTTAPVLTMDYPMFPSLLQSASIANVTVTTPPESTYEDSSGNRTPSVAFVGTGQVVSSINKSLPALTYAPGWFNFTEAAGYTYQLVTINDLERHIEIDGQGNLFTTDAYTVTSQMPQATGSIEVRLPAGARNVAAYDEMGNPIVATLVDKNTTTYSLSLGFSFEPGNSTNFSVNYFLPSGNNSDESGNSEFDLSLPITKNLDSVIGKLTLTVSLPEGASIKEYPSIKGYDLQKEALQEEVLFTAYNVSSYSNLDMHMAYVYSVFWASFRPTLWMTAISAVGVAIALLWQRPKPSLPSPMRGAAVKPQTLKSIVSSYEERARILRELESIERQTQKGKLPRRRYKIRKRMLESQLSRLDRELVDLKQRVKAVGPKYTEILKDLDIAEAELEGVEAEVKRVEARYRSSAISLDAYRRLQDQLNKRREKAKTTIDGALLRLSEGTA